MVNREEGRREGSKVDAASLYIRDLSTHLRIRDTSARIEILKTVEQRIRRTVKGKGEYGDIVESVGDPRKLAFELSDVRNWTVQMGTPALPKVPLVSAISDRGKFMISMILASMFIVSAILFFVSWGGWLVLPIAIMIGTFLYLLVALFFYGFIGYTLTFRALQGSGIRVEPCSRAVYTAQLVAVGSIIISLDLGLMLFPLLDDGSGLVVSVPLGLPIAPIALFVILMAWRSAQVLPHNRPVIAPPSAYRTKKMK